MVNVKLEKKSGIVDIIHSQLTPFVKKIDQEAFYAKHYLRILGEEGFFRTENNREAESILKRVGIVEETAKVCMTTAFCVWCHLAVMTYIENCSNALLKKRILPRLESGELIAGTGLSNPLKTFSKLEKIHLHAKKTDGGYRINGALPAVSNIGPDQAFAAIARLDGKYLMFFVPCSARGLSLKERKSYFGMNGSATYACKFNDVFVPEADVIARDAESFVQSIRTVFVAYQIPLGFGVTASSIGTIEKISNKEKRINKYIGTQAADLIARYDIIRKSLIKQTRGKCDCWDEIVKLRLDTVYLTLDATQTAMIHSGGAGYLKTSLVARKLREAYFLVNLTPTVKHLEKMKHE